MMEKRLVALYGLVVVTSNVLASTLFPHVPLLMWSQRPIFSGSNAYLSSEMDETAVALTIQSTMICDDNLDKEGVLSIQTFSTQQAEVLCLFLLPSLSFEQVSKLIKEGSSHVQSSVQSSVSSVVIPHTIRMKPLLPEMANAMPHIVEADKLELFVASAEGKTVFLNGRTDLLIVQLPESMSLSDVDVAIQTASGILNARSSDKTDFAFTGNDATSSEIMDPLARRLGAQAQGKRTNSSIDTALLCETGYLVGYSVAGKAFCFSHYVNITPDIMAGLLFGLLFVFMAYIGLGVLHQIQTPQRYPMHGAPRGKEF